MGQMLFWLTGFEIFGTAAVIQMLQVILPAEAPALESHAHCTAAESRDASPGGTSGSQYVSE